MSLNAPPLSMLATLTSLQVPSIAQRKGHNPQDASKVSDYEREQQAEHDLAAATERVRSKLGAIFDELFALHSATPEHLSHYAVFRQCAELAQNELMFAALRAKDPGATKRVEEALQAAQGSEDEFQQKNALSGEQEDLLRHAQMAHEIVLFGFDAAQLICCRREPEERDDTDEEVLTRLEQMHKIADAAALYKSDSRVGALRGLEVAAPFVEVLSKVPTGETAERRAEREGLLNDLAELVMINMLMYAAESETVNLAGTDVFLDAARCWRREVPGKWKAVNGLMRALGFGDLKDKSLKDSWTNRRRTRDDERNQRVLADFGALALEDQLLWARALSAALPDEARDLGRLQG
jgi:hypothetical protein